MHEQELSEPLLKECYSDWILFFNFVLLPLFVTKRVSADTRINGRKRRDSSLISWSSLLLILLLCFFITALYFSWIRLIWREKNHADDDGKTDDWRRGMNKRRKRKNHSNRWRKRVELSFVWHSRWPHHEMKEPDADDGREKEREKQVYRSHHINHHQNPNIKEGRE